MVATTGICVPQTSGKMTSPIRTGAAAVMSFKALVQSKIMDFGMSSLVFTDTMGAVPPGHADGRGDDARRIGHFLFCVNGTSAAGVSGDRGHFLTV